MASIVSLFECAASDVTIGRIRDLVSSEVTESLTLEFKREYSAGVVKTVAAMANSYGGIVLLGVTDEPPRELIGVPFGTIEQIVNACHGKLEPPWQPEIIPIPLGEGDNAGPLLILLRVRPELAPRPVLHDRVAPIRLHGRNATADRSRLAELFTEVVSGSTNTVAFTPMLHLTQRADGSPEEDFAVQCSLMMATGRSASWSPLSENGVDVLAAALNGSALGALMIGWTSRLNLGGFIPFQREGFNRARVARLRWHAGADKPSSIEVIAEAKLPETYSDVGTHLMFMIGARFRINLASDEKRPWLDVPDLYELLQAVLLTLTQPEVVQPGSTVAIGRFGMS